MSGGPIWTMPVRLLANGGGQTSRLSWQTGFQPSIAVVVNKPDKHDLDDTIAIDGDSRTGRSEGYGELKESIPHDAKTG
jgi:hypothetical protein